MVQDVVMQFATLNGRDRAKQEFLRYRADILAIGPFPEYKIKLFWRANLSAEDIKNKKDLELWPNKERRKAELEPGGDFLPAQRKHYRALSQKQLNRRILKAMIRETERIGKTHRLLQPQREWLVQLREKLFAMYRA